MRSFLAGPLLLALAGPATAADWPIGTFLVTWPSGYSRVAKPRIEHPPAPNSSLTQFKSRDDDVLVTIEVIGHGPLDPAGEQKVARDWHAYGRNDLRRAAARSGTVVIDPREERLRSGDTLFAAGWDKQEGALPRFGLIFLELSPKGRAAQIVIQGTGDARAEFERFKRIVESARWQE